MRIARFERNGRRSFGFVTEQGIVDATSVPGIDAGSVREFIARGLASEIDAAALEAASLAATSPAAGSPSVVPLAEVTLLPPVELDKVVCAGVNFPTHREEVQLKEEKPAYPVIFTRYPDSHVGDGADLVKPPAATMFDYEGELAVIIGETAWQVGVDEAMDYVFGYSVYNDGSVRDYQFHTHQWQPGKNFALSGSIGPWIVTADEAGDIGQAWLTTRVDGQQRQRAQIKDMVHSIPELIAYISSFTPLRPGDVIAAGTPGGVGLFMEPKGFLTPGQRVEVEIDGIGVLRNGVTEDLPTTARFTEETVATRY